ncbi:MAG TPA: HIT domain-containing protein, partial [Rhodocyclaceae bacterium]|nr:HIT domain-containing protein [Rhodocyclaceae bacterium]
MAACELCDTPGGELIWQDDFCRVVRVNDVDYPGFCRVILNRHVKEMSDLETAQRERLMAVVFAVEAAVREVMKPDKINLASLGNLTPHMHWHVIPR